jgi:hypothetical protein
LVLFRCYVIAKLPSLRALDHIPILEEEREFSFKIYGKLTAAPIRKPTQAPEPRRVFLSSRALGMNSLTPEEMHQAVMATAAMKKKKSTVELRRTDTASSESSTTSTASTATAKRRTQSTVTIKRASTNERDQHQQQRLPSGLPTWDEETEKKSSSASAGNDNNGKVEHSKKTKTKHSKSKDVAVPTSLSLPDVPQDNWVPPPPPPPSVTRRAKEDDKR